MADETKQTQAQLDLQVQINKVLQDRQAILKAQEKALSSQVQLAVDMCKALKCEELDKVEERLKTTREAMAAAAEEAARLKGSLDDVGGAGDGAAKKTTAGMSSLLNKINATTGASAGLKVGLLRMGGVGLQTFKNILGAAGDLVMTLGRVGFGIVSLPFKLLSGLFNLAQAQGGGGPSPILVELENIRKEMGGLNNIAGKAAASALPAFRAQLANVAGTGISLRKMFGRGREGLAKAMAYNLELMKAFGSNASAMSKYMTADTIPALTAYRKGLGLSAEQMAKFMKRAVTLGKNPMKAMDEFANYAVQMGEVVGMSGSEFGKRMAAAADNIEVFGGMSKRSLAEATAYTVKLGIKLEELTGIVDKFDNFEDAAQSVSKLNQMFGMQLDTMEMMNEQDLSKRLKKMQDAYRATGQDIMSMTRVQKKALATTAGLTVEQAELAFSQQGLSQSYDDITKAGAKAEKKQLTQAEAMSKLADSIERVFGSGGGTQFKGFFDAFTQGFARGIVKSREFMKLFRSIRRSLKAVYWGAVEIGRQFVKLFPGISDMARGLSDIFNPQRFRNLMKDLKGVFTKFFGDLRTDPKAGVETFIKNFKDVISRFFGGGGAGAKTFMEGGKNFLKALGGIALAVAPMLLEALEKGISAVADFLADPPEIPGAISKMGTKLWDSLVRLFDVLADRLGPPLIKMFKNLWKRAAPYVGKFLEYAFYASMSKAILSAVLSSFGGAVIGALVSGVKKLFGVVSTVTPPATPDTPGAPNPQQAAKLVPSLMKFMGMLGVLLIAFAAVVAIYKGADLEPGDALAIGAVVISLAGSAALMSVALKSVPDGVEKDASKKLLAVLTIMAAAGFLAAGISAILASFEPPSLGAVAAFTSIILTLSLASIPIIIAASVIGKMEKNVKEAVKGMGVLGLFMIAVGAVGTVLAGMLSLIPDPTGVAALMEAISSIMYATMLMLPVAALLGMMLFTPPFGSAGLVAIMAGFGVLVALAGGLVQSLIPAIKTLAQINIPNPEAFGVVSKALVDIMGAINSFVGAMTGLTFFLSPASFSDETFEGNIKSFKGLVDSILSSGVGEIINNLIAFAQTARIKEGAGEVISAIASVLGSVSQLMQAFSPSGDVMQAIASEGPVDPAAMLVSSIRVSALLDSMEKFQQQSIEGLTKVLPEISKTVSSLISSVGNIPSNIKDVAPFVQAFSAILTAVGSIMKAMSPSDAAFAAVTEAADTYGADEIGMMQEAFKGAKGIADSLPKLLGDIKQPLVDMITGMMEGIRPIIAAAAGVDPKIMGAVAQLMSGTMSAASTLIDAISSIIGVANERTSDIKDAAARKEAFKSYIDSMAGLFTTMGPAISGLVAPMGAMVSAVLDIARGIGAKEARGLKPKIEAVSAALEAVGRLAQIFGPDGPFKGAPPVGSTVPVSLVSGMVTTMGEVTEKILKGPQLKGIIDAFNDLKVPYPKALKTKAEALTSVFEGIRVLSSAMQSMNDASTLGLGQLAQTFNSNLSGGGGVDGIKSAIKSMASILSVAPKSVEGAADRVNAMTRAYNDLSVALNNPLDDTSVKAIVDIGNSLKGQKSLTVKHENVQINLHVDVQMDTASVGSNILKINARPTNPFTGTNNKRFATQ